MLEKKKEWVSDKLFCCYPLLLHLCIQEQQVPRGHLVNAERREQMYSQYKYSERVAWKNWRALWKETAKHHFFCYLITMYNGRKNMKQIQCSMKKKGKLPLLACLLFSTVNILLLCKKTATRKKQKYWKYTILMEISITSKALWGLLIHLALLSLSQHSEWQRDAVIFPSNSLTYWSFVNGTNNCWLLCPKYQASGYILCSSHLQPQMSRDWEEQSCSIGHKNSAAKAGRWWGFTLSQQW